MSLVKPLLTCRETGTYFGYPECCILAFVNKQKKFARPNKTQCKIGKHKGFIPCMPCCRLIMQGHICIEDLIQNRECELSYPNDSGKRILHSHICKSIIRKNNHLRKIYKQVIINVEQDYNSVLNKILINKIIIRRERIRIWKSKSC